MTCTKDDSPTSILRRRRFKESGKGFTLIEALVAVTIVTFAVAGPLFSANRAIVSAQGARLQLTASHLAQEGIEHVRALRDREYLRAYQAGGATVSTDAWNSFVSLISPCSTACSLDPTLPMGVGGSYSLERCASGACTPLYLVTLSNGTLGYSQQGGSGIVTPFTRQIQSIVTSPTEEHIISRVSWSFHGVPYVITVDDHLTSWQ